MKFIAVMHTWFVHSKGFKVEEIYADSEKSADEQAYLISRWKRSPSDGVAHVVIAIEDTESLVNRKLTWKERITGYLDIKHTNK